jgi:hypothetical protein
MTASGESSVRNYECGCQPLTDLYGILARCPGVYGARFSGAGFRGCCIALADQTVAAASSVANAWTATLLIGLAAAAHQGFSANLYTLVSDTAPRRVVSSIVGMGGLAAGFQGRGAWHTGEASADTAPRKT